MSLYTSSYRLIESWVRHLSSKIMCKWMLSESIKFLIPRLFLISSRLSELLVVRHDLLIYVLIIIRADYYSDIKGSLDWTKIFSSRWLNYRKLSPTYHNLTMFDLGWKWELWTILFEKVKYCYELYYKLQLSILVWKLHH